MSSAFWLAHLLKSADIFGADLPGFNLRGKESVQTSCGAIMTIFIVALSFLFASLKLQVML